MWYFDQNGAWTINASIQNNEGGYGENSSTTFTYNLLDAMVVSPSSLTWPSPINFTNTNVGSSNNPAIVNNSGNGGPYNINVTAYDLQGEQQASYYIYASNFTVDNVSAGCSGISMANATSVNVTDAILYSGNNSLNYDNATSGQEPIYFCLKGIPAGIPSQSYSSAAYGAWTIRILLVLAVPYRRRKKKLKKSSENKLKGDNLMVALGLIMDELKQEYSLNKKEIVNIIAERIKDKYKVSRKEILEMIKENEVNIPTSIFSKNLGALESLVRYMKENLNMSYREIGEEIGRDERTIWTAYKKAKEKEISEPKETTVERKEVEIPLSVIKNSKLTVLESVILYLKKEGFRFSEIAELLKRDQRNVWTVYKRAVNK